MKKFILTFFSVIFIAALVFMSSCNKETLEDHSTESSLLKAGKVEKIDVCHFSAEDNTWHIIRISENAWPAHEKNGDVRLDDQDGDGYFPDNECGYEPMGDADDNDVCINPGPPCPGSYAVEGIRVAGYNDGLIDPTCDGSGYIAAFIISGFELPQNESSYLIKIGGTQYQIDFFEPSSYQVVVGFFNLQNEGTDISVEIQITTDGVVSTYNFENVYDAPVCQ